MLTDLPNWPPAVLGSIGLFLALCICISLWSIWHAYWHKFPTDVERIIWLVVAVMVPFFGGFAYLIYGRTRGQKWS